MNLPAGQQWRRRHREQTCGHSGGRRGWDKLREERGNTHITVCRTDGQRGFAARFGELNPALWDSLEGWEGVGGSRGRGQMYTYG